MLLPTESSRGITGTSGFSELIEGEPLDRTLGDTDGLSELIVGELLGNDDDGAFVGLEVGLVVGAPVVGA